MAYTLKPICLDLKILCFSNSSPLTCVVGVLPPPGRGLQLWEQRTDWPAGDCSRHSDCDCNQSGAFEEETVRYHQSWHRGGESAIDFNVPLRHKQTSNKTHTVWFTPWSWMVVEVSALCLPPLSPRLTQCCRRRNAISARCRTTAMKTPPTNTWSKCRSKWRRQGAATVENYTTDQ